jgi:uncharacterized membrane protein YccF (DUF307 family)
MRVTNGIPLGSPLPLTVATVNYVATLKGTLNKRPLSERSVTVQKLFKTTEVQAGSGGDSENLVSIGNVMYVLMIGWWLSLIYLGVGAICWVTLISQDYTKLCWDSAFYFFWPFGKYVVRMVPAGDTMPLDENVDTGSGGGSGGAGEATALLGGARPRTDSMVPLLMGGAKWGAAQWRKDRPAAFAVWCVVVPVLWVAHIVATIMCGFFVVYIPMAKIHWKQLRSLIFYNPTEIRVSHNPTFNDKQGTRTELVMCTFQAANYNYYKFTVDNINIVIINMLGLVRCAFSDKELHSRMPLEPTPLLRLKRCHACDQWHFSREFTASYRFTLQIASKH